MTPAAGSLWLARAGAWASAGLVLTVGAHVVGGGAPPSPTATAVIAATLLWTGAMLTRERRLGRTTLVATLGASQLGLHWLLTLSEGTAACSAVGHGHHETLACSGGGHAALSHGHDGLLMLAAHLTAAVTLGLLLAKGEDLLWLLAGLLRPALPAAVELPARRVGHVLVRVTVPAARPVPLGGVGKRGPPVGRIRPIA